MENWIVARNAKVRINTLLTSQGACADENLQLSLEEQFFHGLAVMSMQTRMVQGHTEDYGVTQGTVLEERQRTTKG